MLLDPLEAMTAIGLEAMTSRYRGPLTTDLEGEAHYHDTGERWDDDSDPEGFWSRPGSAPLSPEVLECFDRDSMPRKPGEEEVF